MIKFYKNIWDYVTSVSGMTRAISLATFEKMIDDPVTKQLCDKIAEKMAPWSADMTKEEKKALKDSISVEKKKLQGWVCQAHFPNGQRSTKKEPAYELSCIGVLDLDEMDSPETVYHEKVEPLCQTLHIFMAFITPSLHGLKLFFLMPQNMSIEMAQRWMAEQLDVTEWFDTTGKDPARIAFAVPRSYILYCDKAKLFDTSLTNEGYTVDAPASMLLDMMEQQTPVKETECISSVAPAEEQAVPVAEVITDTYLGIPLKEIIDMYWVVNNDGKEPCVGDRDTKTFELADKLRYICDNNVEVLNRVIPCYAGFTPAEKLAKIKSAVSYEIKSMPTKMAETLKAVKRKYADNREIVQALDEAEEQDSMYHIDRLMLCFSRHNTQPPMGLRDSFEGVHATLHMPVLIGIGPFIGGLATGVELLVHDDLSHLNLLAYIVGESASGKSKLDKLYKLWCYNLIQDDDVNIRILEDWKALPNKEKEKTAKPQVIIRIQPLRCSVADVLDHLNNSGGKHLISFGSEGDQLTQSKKSGSFANVSVILRQSYDGSEFKSSYNGSSAVNANIKETLWNISQATTPDGLHRALPNVTDGEQNRYAIASTPDNTFAPLVRVKSRSEEAQQNIIRVAGLLELMQGKVELPELEQVCADWVEKIRLETLKNDDRVMARQRMRVAVTSMRYVCCLMLCGYAEWLIEKIDNRRKGAAAPKWTHGAETAADYLKMHPQAVVDQLPKQMQRPEYLETFEVIADYLMENTLYYFRKRIETAYQKEDYIGCKRRRRGENDSIFDSLGQEFSLEEARQAKGQGSTDNAAKQMVKNWCAQGLCVNVGRGRYKKL